MKTTSYFKLNYFLKKIDNLPLANDIEMFAMNLAKEVNYAFMYNGVERQKQLQNIFV